MLSKEIIFIINPVAGTRSKLNLPALIKANLDTNKFGEPDIVCTEYGGHAHELAKEAVRNGYKHIIAVGGDGTVNEVASAMVNTEATLGILPLGSGNGLARHLKIPLNISRAIQLINHKKVKEVDSCRLNDKYFFCTAGVGFDAHIGTVFSTLPTRGLKSYIQATFREFFSYRPHTYNLNGAIEQMSRKAFLITFANAGQYGNNAYIAPQADIADGLMDICILHPFPKFLALPIGVRLFKRNIHRSPYMETFRTSKVVLEERSTNCIHLDGEPFNLSGDLEISVVPQSLRVLSYL
jgi:diacylglycerol kinase (ATP)